MNVFNLLNHFDHHTILNYEPKKITLDDLLTPEAPIASIPIREVFSLSELIHPEEKRPLEEPEKNSDFFKRRRISHEPEVNDLTQEIQQLFEGKINFSQFVANYEQEFPTPKKLFQTICNFSDIEHLEKIDLRFYSDLSEHTSICKSQISYLLLKNLASHAVSLNKFVFNAKSFKQISTSFTNLYPKHQENFKRMANRVRVISWNESISQTLKKRAHILFPNAEFVFLRG